LKKFLNIIRSLKKAVKTQQTERQNVKNLIVDRIQATKRELKNDRTPNNRFKSGGRKAVNRGKFKPL